MAITLLPRMPDATHWNIAGVTTGALHQSSLLGGFRQSRGRPTEEYWAPHGSEANVSERRREGGSWSGNEIDSVLKSLLNQQASISLLSLGDRTYLLVMSKQGIILLSR